MKKTVLSVFVLSLFIGSALTVGSGMQTISSALSLENNSALSVIDEADNNHLPKSLLVYTEFADDSAGPFGELRNTLAVVNDNFLNDYHIANLTDFNELPSVIMDYDVFLIPEQERLYDENLTAIATAWSGVLQDFVSSGGILVVMDCYGMYTSDPYGPMLQTLNATGLITYTEAYAYPGSPFLVSDANDALARGIPNSFPGTDGSLRFNGTGETVVFEDAVGPVVVHQTMGMGHIAILGFDLYRTAQPQENILINAIQLTRHVVFDQSHSPYGVIHGAHLNYSLDLVSEGYAVSAMPTWDPATIEMCDVLILTTGTATYSPTEVDVIEDFVASGGGLLIFTDYGHFGEELDPVANRFGFYRNETGYVYDTNDVPTSSYTPYNQTNFETHSIMLKVYEIELDRGGVFLDIPSNAVALATTDTDGTSFYDDGTPANGLVVAAAASVGRGRVSVVADRNFLSAFTDPDTDGINTYFDSGNTQFLLNSVRWASGAGSEEQVVLFDESIGPNWYLNASYFGFANYLTELGYTIRWMWQWDTTLIGEADVLVIQDGTRNHTAGQLEDIVEYVETGGGLCLLGGQTVYGVQADLVGNEFGLDINNTGYITDTDDWLDPGHQNIYYNASNIMNHPITNGVSRLELHWTTAFTNIGAGTSLVRTDSDGTSTWIDGTPANGLTLMTALEYDMGRVFFAADYIFPRYNADYDLDGVPILYDSDNDILLQNVFRWLSENRAPNVDVIDPNGGEVLSGMVFVNWTAVDFDSDPLTFDIYYSDNSGSDWTPLAMGLTGTQYEWNTTMHDDGANYLIRIEVSDGNLRTMDASDATFELDNFGAPPGGGFPIDPLILAAIIGGALVIIIIIVLIMKKRGGGK